MNGSCLSRVATTLTLALAGFVSRLHATSVTFTPIQDATISEKTPDSPLGSALTLDAGTTGPASGYADNRALLRFDLAAIPSNAVIVSASLALQLTKTALSVSATNMWLDLHKVLRAWSESAATWTNRLSPPSPWSAPGAAPPVDYAPSVTQSNLITPTLGSYIFSANAKMVADVQNWVANPATNFGWIMISELEGVPFTHSFFGSRESGADAPTLTVQFVLPATPPTLTTLSSTNGWFRFQFNAESNRTYAVEYSSVAPATNWAVLSNIPASLNPTALVVSDPLTSSNRYYRVRTP